MNENHTITLQDKKWGMPVRVLTLITFFLGAVYVGAGNSFVKMNTIAIMMYRCRLSFCFC